MSAAAAGVRSALLKWAGDESVTVTHLSATELQLSKAGLEVVVDAEARLIWPTPQSTVTYRHTDGFLAAVLGVLFPDVHVNERWTHLALRQGAEIARLRAAVQTANEYTDLRVAALEQRLTLMQESVDSACALAAKVEDELPRRRRRQANRSVSVSSSESMQIDGGEDDED
jgi:hypothetical protein